MQEPTLLRSGARGVCPARASCAAPLVCEISREPRRGGAPGATSFGYFSWQDKKSDLPPAPFMPAIGVLGCLPSITHKQFSEMPSATIKIFLVHGDPKRLRTAELSNWTGKAVAGPRSEFDGVLSRDESDSSGVYFFDRSGSRIW